MRVLRFVFAFLSIIWGISQASALAGAPADAVALVERVYAMAFEVAGDRSAGRPQDGLHVLRDSFDGSAIARVVLGDRWERAAAGERREFVDALLDAIVGALVRRIGRYRAQDVTVVGTRAISNGDILVRSRLVSPLDDPLTVDWRVRGCGARPCIVDLLVGGASVSLERRNDVAARLAANDGSLSELIADLRKDAADAVR
ncbi:MAG: ABC transporter substrate-binding protein [Bauldia sp.]